MPLLDLVVGEIFSAFVVIALGIWIETHYVSYYSVVVNILGVVVTLVTLDFEPYMWAFLTVYLILGVLTVWRGWKKLYVLLGSKTYGSLMLVLGLFSIQGTYTWLNQTIISWNIPSLPEIAVFSLSFLIVGLFVHFVGWIYATRTQD